MGFTSQGPRPWPLPPDWGDGLNESLEWATEVLRAVSTASTQHRSLLDCPLRSFELKFVEEASGQRTLDALLAFAGANTFLLPIFPDVQYLGAAISSGAVTISCQTHGFDFVAGGHALLWQQVNVWEVVDLSTVGDGLLTLEGEVEENWPIGTRLYPLRRAVVRTGAEEVLFHDDASSATISFLVTEPCDWPAIQPPTTYRDHAVLEWVPDEGERRSSGYSRDLVEMGPVAGNKAPVDVSRVALAQRAHRFELYGRAEQAAFRSLLYWLRGRSTPVWKPSWRSDLTLASAVAALSTTLVVDWCGYALWGVGQVGRRDVRIALRSGQVLYRRLTAAAQFGATEQLTLDTSLGVAVSPADVMMISFMSLCTLASDAIEIQHDADSEGRAVASTAFLGVVDDV